MKLRIASIIVALAAAVPAYGGIRTNDYSWVRGTHYRVNGDAVKTARELAYGKRVRLNAVRFWVPGMGAWRKNPQQCAAGVKEFVRQARKAGYCAMPVLFNGNGLDPAMLEGEAWDDCRAYAKSYVDALKDEDGLLMWDVMNEPAYNAWIANAPTPEEKRRRLQKTFEFTRRATELVKSLDPGSYVTLGCATPAEAARTAGLVDVISFHDYSSTRADIEKAYSAMEKLGRDTGKPVLQTETGCTAYGNGCDMAIEACRRHGFGWFFFNLIIHDYTETFHGVFYADGTVRDLAAIGAMAGCYRSRDLDTIVPAKPFKPGKEARLEKTIAGLRKAIDGAPAPVLLEEMERAANYLEACELVPMAIPPTAKIFAWRKMSAPPMDEIRAEAARLAGELESALP